MRHMDGLMSNRVHVLKVGDWLEKLTIEHLAVFCEKCANMIRALGYEVH